MPDYSKGQIYHIYCNITGEIYYGSTCNTLAKRIGQHRTEAKNENSKKKNIASRSIINRSDYDYSLIEKYKCNNKQELHARERYWIENNECVNKKIPGRTQKEYYQDNKEKVLEYQKNYKVKNIEKINQRKREHYQENKKELLEYQHNYREANIDKIKQIQHNYREANVDKIKQYRKENKDKIIEYGKQKVVCECGCELSKCSLYNHRKTKFHQEFIQSLGSGGNTI